MLRPIDIHTFSLHLKQESYFSKETAMISNSIKNYAKLNERKNPLLVFNRSHNRTNLEIAFLENEAQSEKSLHRILFSNRIIPCSSALLQFPTHPV